jgi:hypothetical protein
VSFEHKVSKAKHTESTQFKKENRTKLNEVMIKFLGTVLILKSYPNTEALLGAVNLWQKNFGTYNLEYRGVNVLISLY